MVFNGKIYGVTYFFAIQINLENFQNLKHDLRNINLFFIENFYKIGKTRSKFLEKLTFPKKPT